MPEDDIHQVRNIINYIIISKSYYLLNAYTLQVAELVRHCMENAIHLHVPLKVKIQIGATWGSMRPLNDPVVRSNLFSQHDDNDL